MSQSIKNQTNKSTKSTKPRTLKVPTKGPAMRVAVAKDVLYLLRRGLVAKEGSYFEKGDAEDTAYNQLRHPQSPATLQAVIPKLAKNCHVCAKGAIVMAHIHLLDGMDQLPMYSMNEKAQEIWGKQNADLIELAFESGPGEEKFKSGNPQRDSATQFGAKYNDPAKRLRAIMRNIIANNGTFKP